MVLKKLMGEPFPQETKVGQEIVDKIIPELTALAWQNFQKNLNNGLKLEDARQTLLNELNEFSKITELKNKNLPLLKSQEDNEVNPTRDIKELKEYLNKKFNPYDSYICNEGLLPKTTPIPKSIKK